MESRSKYKPTEKHLLILLTTLTYADKYELNALSNDTRRCRYLGKWKDQKKPLKL